MTDNEYTPTRGTFGHGCINLTYFPSSQRIGVLQIGRNAVMDSRDLIAFIRDAGLLYQIEARARVEGATRMREQAAQIADERLEYHNWLPSNEEDDYDAGRVHESVEYQAAIRAIPVTPEGKN